MTDDPAVLKDDLIETLIERNKAEAERDRLRGQVAAMRVALDVRDVFMATNAGVSEAAVIKAAVIEVHAKKRLDSVNAKLDVVGVGSKEGAALLGKQFAAAAGYGDARRVFVEAVQAMLAEKEVTA